MSDTTEVVVEEERVNSGLQSAVRYEFMTPQEALQQVSKWKSEGNYVMPSLIKWIERRM